MGEGGPNAQGKAAAKLLAEIVEKVAAGPAGQALKNFKVVRKVFDKIAQVKAKVKRLLPGKKRTHIGKSESSVPPVAGRNNKKSNLDRSESPGAIYVRKREKPLDRAGKIDLQNKRTISKGALSKEPTIELSKAPQFKERPVELRRAIASGNNNEIGVVREKLANDYLISQYGKRYPTKIDGGSNHGIDGMYVKNGKVYVNEVKGIDKNGRISLRKGTDGTVQMSNDWIDQKIQAMRKSGNPDMEHAADLLEKASRNGNLVKTVTGVDSNGNIKIIKLK